MPTHAETRRNPRLVVTAVLTAVLLCQAPRSADALGVLVTKSAESPQPFILGSRTLVTRTPEGRIQQMTEIHYNRGDQPSFYWLLPVLADGEVTVRACPGSFEELAKIAAPRIILRHRGAGDGCSGDGSQDLVISDIGAHPYTGTPVDPLPEPEVIEPFEDFAELQSWISSHDLSIPGNAAGTLHYYVDHGYTFVATGVSFISSGRICLETEFDFPPHRIYDYLLPVNTAATAVREMEVLIYVVDEGRVRPYADPATGAASYYAVELNPEELRMVSEDESNYAELFREAIDSRVSPSFVVEYSAPLEEVPAWINTDMSWLTRMRIWISPSDVSDDPQDPETDSDIGSNLAIVSAGDEEVGRDYTIIIAAARRHGGTMLAAWAFAMIGVAFWTRRRGSRRS